MVFFYQEEVQGFERVKASESLVFPEELELRAGDTQFPSVSQEDVLGMPFIWDGKLQYA